MTIYNEDSKERESRNTFYDYVQTLNTIAKYDIARYLDGVRIEEATDDELYIEYVFANYDYWLQAVGCRREVGEHRRYLWAILNPAERFYVYLDVLYTKVVEDLETGEIRVCLNAETVSAAIKKGIFNG